MKNSWNLTFAREWMPYVTIPSVLQLRSLELRRTAGGLIKGNRFKVRMRSPVRGPVTVREVGSDLNILKEVFVDEVYKPVIPHLRKCDSFMDIGANIGLASLYFAHRFPQCKLFSVEPNRESFELLQANLQPFIDKGRCQILNAALWGTDADLVGVAAGNPDYFSEFSTREAKPGEANGETIRGISITRAIEESGFERVDCLKVDIEGAELQLFQGNVDWLNKIDCMAIEFHDNSRAEIGFNKLMAERGFRIYDADQHTVVAVRN